MLFFVTCFYVSSHFHYASLSQQFCQYNESMLEYKLITMKYRLLHKTIEALTCN